MNAQLFLSLGIIFLIGFIFASLLKKVNLPSVTSYLLLGIILGPMLLKVVDPSLLKIRGIFSKLVLSFIAFYIGENFSRQRFREIGKAVISLSLAQSLAASLFAGGAVYLLTGDRFFTLALAAIAPATAPAAVVMVVRELRARGKFTDTLVGIVAFDDAWGLIIFSLILAVLRGSESLTQGLMHGGVEIIGAIGLGLVLGWLFTKFSDKARQESSLLVYTLGFILLTAGVSLYFEFSVLLANMALSATITNLTSSDNEAYDKLEKIDPPFYILFFVLAGASLELELLETMGLIGAVYMAGRMAGKIIGTWVSAFSLRLPQKYGALLGIGLAPQAGAALGMAMIVDSYFPEAGGQVLTIIIASTVVFEIFGPILTRMALYSSGSVPSEDGHQFRGKVN